MKLLLDFLPIILFFATFKWAGSQPEDAARWASDHVGFLVQGGDVGPAVAPVLLATLVVMAATAAQVAWTLMRGQRVDAMLWLSLTLVVTLGAATVWFHSETFIKWKPTLLYGGMGAALALGQLVWKRNLLRLLLAQQLRLPEPIWVRLNWAWTLFFLTMAVLNLWVAYAFDTETWVNFKLFGGMGLLIGFSIAQAVWLARHVQDEEHKTT